MENYNYNSPEDKLKLAAHVCAHLSLPFQQHSNLSKMQSFSYSEHNLLLRYSCTY